MGKRIPHGKGDKGGSHPQSGRDLVRYKRNRLERGKCSGLKPDRSEALPMCAACAPPGPQRAEQGGRDFTGLNLRTPQADTSGKHRPALPPWKPRTAANGEAALTEKRREPLTAGATQSSAGSDGSGSRPRRWLRRCGGRRTSSAKRDPPAEREPIEMEEGNSRPPAGVRLFWAVLGEGTVTSKGCGERVGRDRITPLSGRSRPILR